ncbi:uncharacterized protein LOC144822684 [Lissotriton helveticus]
MEILLLWPPANSKGQSHIISGKTQDFDQTPTPPPPTQPQDQASSESPGHTDVEDEPGPAGKPGQTETMSLTVPTTTLPTPVATSLLTSAPTTGGSSTGSNISSTQVTGVIDTQANIASVQGTYEENQGVMGQVLEKLREVKQLQSSIDRRLDTHNDNMGQLIGVLRDINNTLCMTFALPPTPYCGPTTSGPFTSAAATGREPLKYEDSSDTPEPAAADPPALIGRDNQKTQQDIWLV